MITVKLKPRSHGDGAHGDPYRCDACRRKKNRCDACRAARQEAKRELQMRKRAGGICLECADPALPEQTRCEKHRLLNAKRSARAHAKRRAKARKRKAA